MPTLPTTSDLNIVAVAGVAILAWYLFQIVSRKQERLLYKIRRTIVGMVVYVVAALILARQGLPPLEIIFLSVPAGMGCAWLFVNPPKRERRISSRIRREVIARDLTSKGLKWDPAKHHIDHVVPFSRGGDHSSRNLRVIEKQKNLRKGGKMPSFWDFLKK
jgi:hypothetical protein